MYDFLQDFTKEEIILWIRNNAQCNFDPPKKSDLIFIRWQKRTEKLNEKRNKSTEMLQSIDIKEHDRLANLYNNETDITKRSEILKKLLPYYEKLKGWRSFEKSIEKEETDINAIYESIDIERKKENKKSK